MTLERQRYPDVAFVYGSKVHLNYRLGTASHSS